MTHTNPRRVAPKPPMARTDFVPSTTATSIGRRVLRPGLRSAALFFLMAASALAANATLTNFTIASITAFSQNSANAPTAPIQYYVLLYGDMTVAGQYDTSSVAYPGPGSPASLPVGGNFFFFQSPVFTTAAAWQAAFPFGAYTLTASNSGTGATAQAVINYTANAYGSSIPALTPATYAALQNANPGAAITLSFNSFTPSPAANQSFTEIRISEVVSGQNQLVFDMSVAPSTTSVLMPANTLSANKNYFFELLFDDRINGGDAVNNVFTVQEFELSTSGTFSTGQGTITPPPPPPQSPTVTDLYGLDNPAVTGPVVCTAGDPVNCATGNLVETVNDLTVRGRGRFLRLVRTYNGLDAASAASPGAAGFGWTHSYAEPLSFDSSGNATVHQGNGSTVPFTASARSLRRPRT